MKRLLALLLFPICSFAQVVNPPVGGGGGGTSGTVLVTSQGTPTFTFTNPPSLQSVITSAGANSDIQLGCGTYSTTGLTLSNANVHLHGSNNSSGTCVQVNFTGSPTYGMHITASNLEIDHINFGGAAQQCVFRDATTNVRIHDNYFTGCGSFAASGTAVFNDVGGSENWTYDNTITGNGTPQTGAGGACFNYQIAGVNTPSWKGGTWGSVACPQSGGYVAVVNNERRPHWHNNHVYGNNLYLGITYFDSVDIDDAFNEIDQNNAYQNDTDADALIGQGYAEACYITTAKELLTGSMTRASNTVTWTGPNGTVIPFKVGDRIIVQFGFGSGGSDFNDGSPFEVLTVANSGGTGPTISWYQPGPDDTDSTLVDIGAATSGQFVSDVLTNTASSGFYSAGCTRAQLIGLKISHAAQMYPTGGLAVGGLGLNAMNFGIVDSVTIDTVINTNQRPVAGQQYAPNGIAIGGAYNLQISNPQIKNVTNDGIRCITCPNITVTGGTIDGFGNGTVGIAYPGNNQDSGINIKGTTIKGFTLAGIIFPVGSTNWGVNNTVEGVHIFGNTAAAPTTDCAVFQTAYPVRMVDSTCDGASLGQTGTMKFGIINSAPNSLFQGNHIKNLTISGGLPYDDSSGNSNYQDNVEVNNVGVPLFGGGVGTDNNFAFLNAAKGIGAGSVGVMTGIILQGNCNGAIQEQIGLASGGIFNTSGCMFSSGGYYSAYNATQTGSNNWVATAAGQPTSIFILDNTGISYWFKTAGTCPTTGTNTFATCFGTTATWKITTSNVATLNGLVMPLLNSALTNTDLISNTGTFLVDSGISKNSVVPLYNTSGTILSSSHQVYATGALSGGTLAITLSGASVYTSSSSYACFVQDTTTPANAVTVAYSSGTAFTFTGTGTDAVRFQCTGN